MRVRRQSWSGLKFVDISTRWSLSKDNSQGIIWEWVQCNHQEWWGGRLLTALESCILQKTWQIIKIQPVSGLKTHMWGWPASWCSWRDGWGWRREGCSCRELGHPCLQPAATNFPTWAPSICSPSVSCESGSASSQKIRSMGYHLHSNLEDLSYISLTPSTPQ